MGRYTIGEVAGRTGFRPSTLRYYEAIGLLAPAGRSSAGYRLYDDADLDRLAFVARAKQLGCTLEEIGDLVAVGEGRRCGPVQRRLHELVVAKRAETRRRIDELLALEQQLAGVADRLAGPAPDAPCSPACACLALETAG